jgi:hypothetical protein
MEKEETKKTGGEGNTMAGEEKRSWYEFCQSKCKGFFNPEEMKEMFTDCCGDTSAPEKKGFNWQNFCKCMPAMEKMDKNQKGCC